MKQFNLDEYLANPSRKVVTRDGKNVRIVCTDKKGGEYPIIALMSRPTETGESFDAFTKDGRCELEYETINDLFFAPEKHEGWINVYKEFGATTYGGVYDYEEEAIAHRGKKAVATIKIEWEE